MMPTPLTKACVVSVLVHLSVLLTLAHFCGALHHSPPTLMPVELMALSQSVAEPVAVPTPEAVALTPPTVLTKPEVQPTLASTPVPAPLTPMPLERLTPPKAIDKPLPKRLEPRPKPTLAAKRHPERAETLPVGPPRGPETKTREPPQPGPLLPLPDEGPAPTGANALGPSTPIQRDEAPARTAEGGEAGAGALFEGGDLPVVPGTGVGGGSGAPGRAGLGWGAQGGDVRTGGLRPEAGGEGPAGGVGSLARMLGGYQILPKYPESARRQGLMGTTLLLFEVLANGRVGAVRVEQSAGHPDFDRAAVEAIKQWRFEPARRGNLPVTVWLRMPVRFVLEESRKPSPRR